MSEAALITNEFNTPDLQSGMLFPSLSLCYESVALSKIIVIRLILGFYFNYYDVYFKFKYIVINCITILKGR